MSLRRIPVRHAVTVTVMGALFAAAAFSLHRTFGGHPWGDLGRDLLGLGPAALLLALAATAVSYLTMTGYDALALAHVRHPLPYRRFGLASFVATAVGNNVGASALVGAALRARIYSAWNVPRVVIARIVGVNLLTLALGVAVLAGGGMVHDSVAVARALRLPPTAVLVLGTLLLAGVAAYLVWAAFGRSLTLRGRTVERPDVRIALAQAGLSTFEWMTMAAALWVLLPAADRPGFLPFAVAFSIATLAGILSNVPGGLGVFETVLVVLLAGTVSPAALAVALVAYRVCYFVLPLLLAVGLFTGHELRRAGFTLPDRASVASTLLALGVACAGVFMVVVGDLPGRRTLDLSAVTISLAGLAAVLMARGLHRRRKAAWAGTVGLLAVVTLVAAGHGDLELAAVTAVLALLLVPARSAFSRGAVFTRPRNPVWSVSAIVLVAAAVWWQEFSGHCAAADAPLFAASVSADTSVLDRIVMAAGALGVLIGGRRIFKAATVRPSTPDAAEMAQVSAIVATAQRSLSQLAFTGDKRFFFSATGAAFLMYQVRGRSWVVMGDPVGDPAEFGALVRDFVAEVDRHAGSPVFYQVLAEHAEVYRAAGLRLAKLGEEALIPLADFSLSGKARTDLRNCRNKAAKVGMAVEFVAPADVDALMPQLRAVSDVWLAERNGKEKRFSLGAFDEDYVRRFPLVVVREGERVIAFATLWTSGDEVRVDLMRRLPDGPRTVMTFLFVECILWAQERGFAAFNLGMAPLSGLQDAESLWDRVGHLVWTHGERFYNFKGLRAFKHGFKPQWQTCYVAARSTAALPAAMMDVATLVGGGLRGVLRG